MARHAVVNVYWIFTTNVTVPVWLGARVPVNVHWMFPVCPAVGAVMVQAVRLFGRGDPQAALTKVVYAGVLSLIFKVESGELLSFAKVIV